MKTNLPPFYIGQRVVALGNNKPSGIKKGDEFNVKGLTQCSCGEWKVDVGFKNPKTGYCMCSCGGKIGDNNGIWWATSKFFAPIETTFQSITFEKVIEIESPLVNVN